MKDFLNKAKAILNTVAIYAIAWTVVISLLFIGLGVALYAYIKNKVRGAFGWIADKYNAMVTKFKTEVSEDTSKA